MKQYYKLLLLVITLVFCQCTAASGTETDHRVDSLRKLLHTIKEDSAGLVLRARIAFEVMPDSIPEWENILRQARKLHLTHQELIALNKIGQLTVFRGDAKKAEEIFSQAMLIAERSESPKLIIIEIRNILSFYAGQSDRKHTLYYTIKGLKLAEQIGNERVVADFCSLLGVYYWSVGDVNRALKMHLKALKKCEQLQYPVGIVGALLDIGTAYSTMGQDDKASHYYIAARKYEDSLINSPFAIEFYCAVGNGYRFRKQYDSAVFFLQKAYKIARERKVKSSEASVLVTMGWLEDSRGRLSEAKKYALEAVAIIKQVNYPEQLPSVFLLLKSIYTKEGNYRKALEIYELYLHTKDSLSNEELRKQAVEKEFEYNLEKKENENKLLVQQNEIQQLELRQDKYIALGVGILILVLGLVANLFIRQNRYKADHQRIKLEQKLLRAQMNPHFVFNSLNSIQQFIMEGKNSFAELYLFKFATLIRDLLESNIKDNISVAEETTMLNAYLEMEALRFGSRFTYAISIDEKINVERTHIPHLMIQPFVENAIWHGLLPKSGDRVLQINIEHDTAETIRCVVDDNGIGREASAKRENTFRKKSLALSFVNQRLELIRKTYHIEGSITISDKKDEHGQSLGTTVMIILPVLNS